MRFLNSLASVLQRSFFVPRGFDLSPPEKAEKGSSSVNCVDLYNRVMAVYQTAPLSPEYNQMAAAYSATCLASAPCPPIQPLSSISPFNITRPGISPTTDMPN